MKKRYFFKSQSSLQRKAIAGGLTATFAFGTVGSGFAGAMNEMNDSYESLNNPINNNNNPGYELKNIKLEELEAKKFDYKNSLDRVKEIDDNYGYLEESIFGEGTRNRVREKLRLDNEEKFNETWKSFPLNEKKFVVFNFFLHYWNCYNLDQIEKNEKFYDLVIKFFYFECDPFYGELKKCGEKIETEDDEFPLRTNRIPIKIKSSTFHKKIILCLVIGVFVILAIFLIVYFAISGSSKQGTVGTDEADSNSGQKGDNQAGNNELNPTEQRQTEEKTGTEKNSGVGMKILKGSVASAIGTGLATSGTYLYNKISSEGKDPEKQKAQNANNEKDNGPFAYIDSEGRVVTKTEEKNDSSNIANADTDISDTEQSPDSSGAENSKREKAENEDDIKDENE